MKNYRGSKENLKLLKDLVSELNGTLLEAESEYSNMKIAFDGNTVEYNTLYGIDEALVDLFYGKSNKLSDSIYSRCQKALGEIKVEHQEMVELYKLVHDNEVSLNDMYYQVIDNAIGNIDNVNSRETIEMYISDMMPKGIIVSHMLKVLEDSSADLFMVWLGNSMETPEPIEDKWDLLNALM